MRLLQKMKKIKKYGVVRSFLVLFRKIILQPFGLLKLYSSYYVSNRKKFKPGSKKWLIATEEKYGGRVINNKHNGGDRMSFWWHNYAPSYEIFIKKYLNQEKPITLVEVGIFKGTGIAIWSDLFPKGRIIGLDHNLNNFYNNKSYLENKGAFQNENIVLHEFDQYDKDTTVLSNILKKNSVDIVIDDGNHSTESIINTMKHFTSLLKDDFVYIIEDNDTVHIDIKKLYPHFTVHNNGEFTVVSP